LSGARILASEGVWRCSPSRSVLKKVSFGLVYLVSVAAARLAIGAVTASNAEAWKEDLH